MRHPAHSNPLGINGLGRIGKLTVWHHVARRSFPHLVVNLGRQAGRSLEAVCDVIQNDSTYGDMDRFLFGVSAPPSVRIVDRDRRLLEVAGTPVTVLQDARNPAEVAWHENGVRVVVDTTGAFDDPSLPENAPGGSLRGHLAAGVEKVVYSAAFKRSRDVDAMPDDCVTIIHGVNHDAYDPSRHHLVSAASCTTTALAHMVKPLLESIGASTIMTASMSTVHAATNSQAVLDNVPSEGAKDLRRNRSVLNSMVLTSTSAARALEEVLPEIREIGFMADSVRVPLPTGSLIILNMTFQTRLDEAGRPIVDREVLNGRFRSAAEGSQRGLLVFSEAQNVTRDIIGVRAAVVIEGVETHTRTGFVEVDIASLPGVPPAVRTQLGDGGIRVPVTHAKVFGWYDNEYGSYTNMLGEVTDHVASALI
ncbi:MAG: glyceraldehyde-3-phosphate dehydrogenase [Actinobacteria bacterium]|nr:glyceraldehyde-3-phosphate dehydrogenase [Thermoleophilia bacterium]MCB9011932.1 glyceraldehyde-3-phosphate dehydrogenase [Actinomycetota bacterium]